MLKTNYRVAKSEIDIIALKQSTLCFVEVKVRKDTNDLCDLLPNRKIQALQYGAKKFLASFDQSKLRNVKTFRFDLAVVEKTKPPGYRWFVNVFSL